MTLDYNEEQRLFNAIRDSDGTGDDVLTFDVEYDGSTYSYDADLWWAEEDHDPVYPEVTLRWQSRGNLRENDQPANQIIKIDEKPDEPEIDVTKARRQYDDLEITCSVDDGVNSDGVPSKVRANALARHVSRFFTFGFDQNEEGPSGERPVLARVNSGPVYASGMIDNARAEIYELVVRVSYTDTYVETVDAVDEITGEVDTTGDGDGSTNSWSQT